jgi:hypothetical protein
MSRYKGPLIIGAVVVLVLMGLKASPVTICIVLAIGCLIFAGIDWYHDRFPTPPPTSQPPDARISFGQRAAGAIAPQIRIEGPAPQQYLPPAVNGYAVPAWSRPLHALSERLHALIGRTIQGLQGANFRADPLLTANQSHLFGVMLSAISRHGHLIEEALFEALSDCERFALWQHEKFSVGDHTAEIDLIVFDKKEAVIRAYEIKRGNSSGLSSHTERATKGNSAAVESQLVSFAASKGFRAVRAVTHVISYYGKTMTQAVGGVTLTEHLLDEHFEVPGLRNAIDGMTQHYKASLAAYLESEKLWVSDAPRVGATEPEMVH